MKILSYNIDHGGREKNNLRGRWPIIIRVVKKSRPDIVIILEAWGWRKNRELKVFAKKTGYKYFFISQSNTKHNIAFLSNLRPKRILAHNRCFHHSCIQFELKSKNYEFTLLGIHLSPINEKIRLRETKKVIRFAKKYPNSLIIGDFNSLAPNDQYNKIKLIRLFRKNNITKFGNKRIETRVMKKFFQSGYVDAVKLFSKKGIQHTVPTKKPTGEKHIARLRFDYALVSKPLISSIRVAKELKNQYTDTESDHYPILLEIF